MADKMEALELLRKVAVHGDIDAQWKLAALLLELKDYIPGASKEALELIHKIEAPRDHLSRNLLACIKIAEEIPDPEKRHTHH